MARNSKKHKSEEQKSKEQKPSRRKSKIQEDKKLEYLTEHVKYELDMLRHSWDRMVTSENVLDRNAFFASFVIHARNLYWALTNNSNSDCKAYEFSAKYAPPKNPEVSRITENINEQVAHLSNKRQIEEEKKLNYRNCRHIADWIEKYMALFTQALDDPFVQHFTPGKHEYKETALTIQGTTASSSSSIFVTSSFSDPRLCANSN